MLKYSKNFWKILKFRKGREDVRDLLLAQITPTSPLEIVGKILSTAH
jgi:hypothetical protein